MQKIKIPLVFIVILGVVFFNLANVAQAAREFRQGLVNLDLFEKRTDPKEIINKNIEYRQDEIIVKFKGEQSFRRIPLRFGDNIESAIRRYKNHPDVAYAEPNYIAYAFFIPNDPYYSYQWHLDNSLYGGIETEEAWEISNGLGTIVAVIDTGAAYENYSPSWFEKYYLAPDLANTSFVAGYDFVNNDTHPNDDNSHGTHVIGTIAQSTNNGIGVAGVAYRASIMPVKVLNKYGSGTYADVADGIRWAADHGAKVINLSLGGSSSASYLEEAVAYAYNKGITVIAAAGNDGQGTVSYPAAYNNYVIAVGATRYDETRAYYSNYGPSLDLVAPGGDLNVDQNGDGYKDGVLQQTFGRTTNDWGYYFYQGTSMATPHVAGVAALIISKGNAKTPSEVRTILESTADDLGAFGRDDNYGYGLVNAAMALGFSPPPDINDPPVIISTPVTNAFVGTLYTYDVEATDPDIGDVLTYSLVTAPLAMNISSTTGLIEWIPANEQTGNNDVTIKVEDIEGLSDIQTFIITVSEAPTEITVFEDSFESGFGKWTQDSQNDWFQSSQRAINGNYSAEVDGRANDAQLISIPLDLKGKTNATISFSWYIESSLDKGEYLAFDVSTDGGINWIEKARLIGNVDPENTWHNAAIELNNISNLKLRFRGKISGSNEDADVDMVKVIAW
ncbi:MAG: S8 family serine peptidase [Patescibacteria group bacterium]